MSGAAHAITLGDGGTGAGDIILDFTQTSGTANLEVDLGPVTQFVSGGSDATGSPVSLTLLSTTDLSNAYGSSWNSLSDNVFWSLIGTSKTDHSLGGIGINTLFGSAAGNLTVPLSDSGSQATESGNIINLMGALGSATATANSTESALLSSGNSLSYNGESGINTSQNDFFGITEFASDFQNQTNGTSTSALYEIAPGSTSSTDLGNFALSSSGLTFTSASAVPEPSTWATLVLGAAALFGLRRRRA
jgi:hypothetical protein